MKKTILVTLSLVLAMFALSFVMPSVAYGQDTKEKPIKMPKSKTYKKASESEVTSTKMEASSGKGIADDPNIKQGFTENDPDTPMTVPASKGGGGSKGAGGNCKVLLDNYTNYAIEIYINGVNKGVLYGGNESTLYYTPGQVTIYAKAPFSDGSYSYWGPTTYSCGSNQYVYYKMNY